MTRNKTNKVNNIFQNINYKINKITKENGKN